MDEVDVFLAHYGVMGMKWGRHKSGQQSSERQKMTPEEKKAIVKKVAIGTGTLLLAAGTAYVAHALVTKGSIKISDLPDDPSARQKAEAVISDPITVMHLSRGKNKGFRFYNDGQSPSPLSEYDKGFEGHQESASHFKKYDGKIAATFLDPEGRKDRAGRPIPHQVIIPKSMADGIDNVNDVVTKIWPIIKEDYSYE
jgi:hypothetical protein